MATLENVLREDDVEVDGDGLGPINQARFSQDRLKISSNKNFGGDQHDSGLFSLSPQTSLESRSLKQEDKVPVQCSDSEAGQYPAPQGFERMQKLEKQLGNLNVQDEDEGVSSFESIQSLRSIGSETSEPVEVDLLEQDVDGDGLIHLAIVGDAPLLASALIDMVEDTACLNLKNDLYQTALHLAIITEHYDIAVQLIKKGADIKCCDKQGNTPMHLACRKGERDVIKALVDTFGKDTLSCKKYFAMKNCEGLTCLHLAAEQKHFILMGYLFAKGADVNMGDAKSGRTILHYAVEKRDLETVALLLTHADINADCKTFNGETPLVLAFWRNYQDIVKKLKSKGAYFSYDLFESDEDSS